MTQTPAIAPTTASTAPVALANSSVVLASISKMSEDELKALHRAVKERLRTVHLLSTDNLNVISVRLPFATCDQIRRLAVVKLGTVSDVIRDAIEDYCKSKGVSR